MTDKEKKDFLSKVLEENGWRGISSCSVDSEGWVHCNYCRWTKNGVSVDIHEFLRYEGHMIDIRINDVPYFSIFTDYVELYSDHMEFTSFGVDVMVRFTDAYVLMEYEPEVESVTDTFTNNLSD